jgi:hypothetical protein
MPNECLQKRPTNARRDLLTNAKIDLAAASCQMSAYCARVLFCLKEYYLATSWQMSVGAEFRV